MRLLRITSDGSFQLSLFAEDRIPPYAILSHTWGRGEDDEVTFEDMMSGSGRSKVGFKKLEFCRDQARACALEYIWVDTCCIDKPNNTELTTAINSMFRWYRKAERCFVYLEDVTVHTAHGQSPHGDWDSAFRLSRWFTRGWTLQELLAPRRVEFFSRDQVRLGDKVSLETQIHQATGLTELVLRASDLTDFSIEERLRWALDRETTVAEDKVYCLLGICDIFMPLIYGEGYPNAMRRLRNEIAGSHQPPPVSPGKPPVFIMPFERSPRFTGRDQELSKLGDLLRRSNQTSKVAIVGLGGVGKTQLAIEYVFRAKATDADLAVFWVQATDLQSVLESFRTFASKLGLPGYDAPDADLRALVQSYLSSAAAGRWLLVFDNADDLDMWIREPEGQTNEQRLIDYLPKNPSGSMLFTSRDRKAAVRLASPNVIEVKEMDDTLATELFRNCLVDPDAVFDATAAQVLMMQLSNLPLAIVQASAYINANGISIDDYSTLLAEQEDTVIELLSEDFEDEWRYRDIKNPVATTWLISFERIRERDPLAAAYLSLMACIDPKCIPRSFLPTGISRKKEADAFGTLNAYCFIRLRDGGQALDLHRLVHLATRSWLSANGEMVDASEFAMRRVDEGLDVGNDANGMAWRKYLPHARCALLLAPRELAVPRSNLALQYGARLADDGQYIRSGEVYRDVYVVAQQVYGAGSSEAARILPFLANSLEARGLLVEAEQLYRQTLAEGGFTSADGSVKDTAIGLNVTSNLAWNLGLQGRWEEAEEVSRQAITLAEEDLGPEHLQTLHNKSVLVHAFNEQKKWTEASQLGQETLSVMKCVLGEESHVTVLLMMRVALAYSAVGQATEAQSLAVRANEIANRTHGEGSAFTMGMRKSLTEVYRTHGRFEEALQLAQQTVEDQVRLFGEDHLHVAMSRMIVASCLLSLGRLAEMGEILRNSLGTFVDQHGMDNDDLRLLVEVGKHV